MYLPTIPLTRIVNICINFFFKIIVAIVATELIVDKIPNIMPICCDIQRRSFQIILHFKYLYATVFANVATDSG